MVLRLGTRRHEWLEQPEIQEKAVVLRTLFCSFSTLPYRSKPFPLSVGMRVVSRNIALSSASLRNAST